MAIDLGINSPKTICITVIKRKLETNDIVVTVEAATAKLKKWKMFSKI